MDPDSNTAGDTTNNEASEWDQAGIDFLTDKGVESDTNRSEQETINEQEESQEDTDKETKTDTNGEEDPEALDSGTGEKSTKTDKTETKSGDETATPSDKNEAGEKKQPEKQEQKQTSDPEVTEKAQRRAQLELEADRKDIAREVRDKMFDSPDRLLDSEGREIRTPQDVTQYRNPTTGKNFTLEEGSAWLMAAQRNLEEQQEADQSQIDKIVDVNLTVKEEADQIMEEYGDFLANNPKLRQELWADYQNTIKTDESGEVITEAPLSMFNYYRKVITPYLAYQSEKEKVEADKKAAEEKAEADKTKKKVEKEKQQDRSDREDIYSTRTKSQEGMDSTEKEWANVAKEYYEG